MNCHCDDVFERFLPSYVFLFIGSSVSWSMNVSPESSARQRQRQQVWPPYTLDDIKPSFIACYYSVNQSANPNLLISIEKFRLQA